MSTSPPKARLIQWKLPFYTVVIAVIIHVVLDLKDGDLGVLGSLPMVLICCFILFVCFLVAAGNQQWKKLLFVLFTSVGYALCLVCLGRFSTEMRVEVRWLRHSKELKTEVLSSKQPEGNGLRHVEVDVFGARGYHTETHLVFSPDDELRNYSSTHRAGLPCEVWKVRRLQKQWYSVTFYSGTSWDRCELHVSAACYNFLRRRRAEVRCLQRVWCAETISSSVMTRRGFKNVRPFKMGNNQA